MSAGRMILNPVWLHLVEDFLNRKQNKKKERKDRRTVKKLLVGPAVRRGRH